MSLQGIKQKSAERGFTIVELLIVIVVIGILAAITIVAYNGVQSRARTTAAQANAKEVQNKAEAYNAASDAGGYPANADAFGTGPTEAKLTTAVGALVKTSDPSSTDQTTIGYHVCGTNVGSLITYWGYSDTKVHYLTAGDSSSCTIPTGSVAG